jgi:diguanylate cyclase (GGDEF)-like protein
MPLTRIVGRTIGRHIRTRPFYLLIVLGALVCAFVIGATIWFLWEQRMAAIQTAGINLQNLSQAVADQTDRILASVEQAEDRLLDHIAFRQGDVTDDRPEMTGSKQLHGVMRDIIGGMSDAYALVLVNASGDLVNFSNDLPVPTLNFADRQYFRFALAHPGTKTFISNAVLSRQTGRSTFFVVRRLTGPDGVFAGLLLGSVEATHLERLFGANALPAGGSVTLFRSNGAMLLRYPAVDTNAMQGRESDFPTSFFGADNGAIRRTGVFDGTNGLTAISDLPRHPLKVAISVAFATVVATWNIAAAWACGIATLACLTTALTIFLAIRQIQGQRRQTEADSSLTVDRERRRADADLAAQHARFGIALDNMSQGLMVFDTTETLLFSNAAALKVFDLDPGALQPGMPFADVIRAVSQVGNLSTDAATVIEFYTKLLRQNVPTKFVLKVPSGRRLAAGFVPYDNGWIITFEDVTESREADDRVLHMAMHDALTGLANRVLLKSWTEKVLADLVKGGDQFAVMCLDLDNFRDVNDMLGHPAGDKLLCEVSRRIQSVTRRSDFVARMGGDEFAIVVRPCDDHSGVVLIASRVVEAIRVPVDIDGQMVQIGTSIGIAMAPADGIDVDTLMKNADLALYRAKSSGRGRYAFFESSFAMRWCWTNLNFTTNPS